MPEPEPPRNNQIITEGFGALQDILNSKDPINSKYYFRDIEGFYYAYKDPSICYSRFKWTAPTY